MRVKMSSTSWRTRISGWMRPSGSSRPGSVTSTAPPGGRVAASVARRSSSAALDLGLERVDERAELAPEIGRQRAELLQEAADRAGLAAEELVVQRLQVGVGTRGGEPRAEVRAQRLERRSVESENQAFAWAGSAALACAATLANAAGCVAARSASILRSSVLPAAFRPRISCE